MSARARKAPEAPQERAAPRPTVREPSVLVLKEKHGEQYFLVQSDQDLHRIALTIVKGRLKDRWYYDPSEEDLPKKPELTEDEVAAMKPSGIKKMAEGQIGVYKAAMRHREIACEDYAGMVKALQAEDGRGAWNFLRNRRDHEYEGFSIERLCTEYR